MRAGSEGASPLRPAPAADAARDAQSASATLARAIVVACCLLAGAMVVRAASSGEAMVQRRPLSLLPMHLGEWSGQPGPSLDEQTRAALGVDDFVNRVYSAPGLPPVALYVGFYKSQREGDTIHSPLNCLPGAGWEPVARTRTAIRVTENRGSPRSEPIVVNRLVIQKGLDRDMVVYWYQGHGRVVASEYWGRVLMAYDAFRLHRTDGALVRVIAPIASADGTAEAERTGERALTAFVRTLYPALTRYLPR